MMIQKARWVLIFLIIIFFLLIFSSFRRLLVIRSLYELNSKSNISFRTLKPPSNGQKILIFAPHEDDETLGCGGYIQKAVESGAQVKVVLVTNGEYPEVDVVLFEETIRLNPDAYIRLGYKRQKETITAMQYLGLSSHDVIFLGYPNQYLNQMWLPDHWMPDTPVRSKRTKSIKSPYNNSMTPDTVYCGSSLLHDIKSIVLHEKPDTIVTLHPNDIHVDHWPVYTFVKLALEELAIERKLSPNGYQLYTYLIHRDLWPSPRGYYPSANLVPPFSLTEIKQTQWMVMPLAKSEVSKKRHAISAYKTQGGFIDPLLLSFVRRNELFGIIPYKKWSASHSGTTILKIIDPHADRFSVLEHPDADIRSVTLKRKGNRLLIKIVTSADIKNSTGFHLVMHIDDSDKPGLSIVRYDWNAASSFGLILQKNKLVKISPGNLYVEFRNHTTSFDAPLPYADRFRGFVMVSAWSTHKKRIIDNTATATTHIDD